MERFWQWAWAKCGDLSLAYQVFGDGPIELVVAGSFASHVELYWTLPEFEAFAEQLSTHCRVLLFDKAGVGLSDPVPKVRTLDDRATEIEAVMDAAGFKKAVAFGMSEGGPAAIVFAATRPERTRALILGGTSSFSSEAPTHHGKPQSSQNLQQQFRNHYGGKLWRAPRPRIGGNRPPPSPGAGTIPFST